MSSTTNGVPTPQITDDSMPDASASNDERLIIHSEQAHFISTGKLDSLLHPIRLKMGSYLLSDGTTDFGTITLTARPTKVSSSLDKYFSDTTPPLAKWWGSARTLYEHKFEFDPIVDRSSVLNQYKIDSTIFPAQVYIIPQTMSGA